MALPASRISKLLSRVQERSPLTHYLQERNAAEALAVTLASSIPENCNQARVEAWKKLPQRPQSTVDLLKGWDKQLAALSEVVNNDNQGSNHPQQEKPRYELTTPYSRGPS
jgi:hypothetical protein